MAERRGSTGVRGRTETAEAADATDTPTYGSSVGQLLQAMARFDSSSGAADGSSASFVDADMSEQTFLTTPRTHDGGRRSAARVQALFCRGRHQPRRPPLAKIKPADVLPMISNLLDLAVIPQATPALWPLEAEKAPRFSRSNFWMRR
jgi:hypothetical protein